MCAFSIRPVTPAHQAQIRAMSDATQRAHQARLPHVFHDGGAAQRALLDAVFAAERQDSVAGYMAVQGDDLVGYVLLILRTHTDDDTPINALIADICVAEAFHQQGVASALLAHCKAEKQHKGWESLRAQVWQGNEASHRLFARAGYTAERTDYRLGRPSVPQPPQVSSKRLGGWLVFGGAIAASFIAGAILS